jgi:DNA segregation ATPase FtsK/SpoIIIE, S-DNA-T family
MLFMTPGADSLRRVHGAFVADLEVKRVVDAVRAKCQPVYDDRIMAMCERALEEDKPAGEGGSGGDNTAEYDDMYDKCVELVLQKGQASTSMLQRAFRLGYNRAARIIDTMEREGIVGPMDGVKPREVRVPTEAQRAGEAE